ncbi:L,D-transpeptidase family protein [Streptomyces sp. NPDC005898]|uniref:L,D-transpeptidase family protein n=1 Tax=Streptomyces sp. NPDC005898 TaxID=3157082 RepID=UPI0033FA9C63
MRPRAAVLARAALLAALGTLGAAPGSNPPLPERMADTGGGSQLITAQAPRADSTTGTLTWWDRRGGRWVRAGSAPARFGANGLAAGASRRQGTDTTPTGLYALPYAFGLAPRPPGTHYPYRRVTKESWWCQDNRSQSYNRWSEPLAADCRAAESEHLVTYDPQYRHALVIGFNYDRPVRDRGAGIFLHVNGRGATAGCVSVSEEAMRAVLRWVRPDGMPHIAIGTTSGPTALAQN